MNETMTLEKAINTIDFEMGLHYSTEKSFIEPEKMDEAREVLLNYLDTENELGINLLTFIKVLKAPEIYVKRGDEILTIPHCDIEWDIECNSIAVILEEESKENSSSTLYGIYNLKDYGKTWSLNKEDLK